MHIPLTNTHHFAQLMFDHPSTACEPVFRRTKSAKSVSDHLCYHILPAKTLAMNFRRTFWLNVCPIGTKRAFSSLPCSCLPGVYHGNLLKLAPKPKHQKNSQALYACTNKHGVLAKPPPGSVLFFKTHLHSIFSFSEKGFFQRNRLCHNVRYKHGS